MAGSSWPTLQAGAKARASHVEAKFDWIEGNIVPMNAGVTTDAAYDLGTSSARWRDVYSRRAYISEQIAIGTTSPSDSLQVVTSGNFAGVFQKLSANANAWIKIENDARSFLVGIRGDTNDNFTIYDNTISRDVLTVNTESAFKLLTGASIKEFSTDGTLSDNSDAAVPTEKAVKTYVDTFTLSGTGTAAGPSVVAIGGSGSTITSLSLTADGSVYQFQASVNFNVTTTASNFNASLEIVKDNATIGSTDAVPGGFGVVELSTAGATASGYSFQIVLLGLMSLTSGGHTFDLKWSGGNVQTSGVRSFAIRKFRG